MARTGLDGHRSTTSSPRWSYGMAHENPRWEYKRIEGELLKFGFCRSSAESERRLATFVATHQMIHSGAERVWLSVSERNLAVADASSLPGRIPRAASWGAVLSRPETEAMRILARRYRDVGVIAVVAAASFVIGAPADAATCALPVRYSTTSDTIYLTCAELGRHAD
jgi:hypothetical protein